MLFVLCVRLRRRLRLRRMRPPRPRPRRLPRLRKLVGRTNHCPPGLDRPIDRVLYLQLLPSRRRLLSLRRMPRQRRLPRRLSRRRRRRRIERRGWHNCPIFVDNCVCLATSSIQLAKLAVQMLGVVIQLPGDLLQRSQLQEARREVKDHTLNVGVRRQARTLSSSSFI